VGLENRKAKSRLNDRWIWGIILNIRIVTPAESAVILRFNRGLARAPRYLSSASAVVAGTPEFQEIIRSGDVAIRPLILLLEDPGDDGVHEIAHMLSILLWEDFPEIPVNLIENTQMIRSILLQYGAENGYRARK
jgi:hypothetical protein